MLMLFVGDLHAKALAAITAIEMQIPHLMMKEIVKS